MSKKSVKYDTYFKVGQQVKLGHSHPEKKGPEINGEIVTFMDNRARVEIIGGGLPPARSAKGTEIFLSGWSGWGFYICGAVLEEKAGGMEIDIRLVGKVEEYQRREYFRWDVNIPVLLSVPVKQQPGDIKELWTADRNRLQGTAAPVMRRLSDGYKVAAWKGGEDILPQNLNLSGGGIRLRTGNFIAPGTKVRVDLFLPIAPSRVIASVAEVLRCSEISLRIEKDSLFITAVRFTHIDEKDRETIISYLFAEQRNSLQSDPQRNLPEPRLR
jgi:hypothetical protein